MRAPFDRGAVPRLDADLVHNLVEGYEEPIITRVIEAAGLPFTGSSAATLETALDKRLARAALTAARVPVPRGCVLAVGDEPIDVRFPAVVKPSREDVSHGITLDSIVENSEAARERAMYVIERYQQPALVEEFIAGAEFSVSSCRGQNALATSLLGCPSWLGGSARARTRPNARFRFYGVDSAAATGNGLFPAGAWIFRSPISQKGRRMPAGRYPRLGR